MDQPMKKRTSASNQIAKHMRWQREGEDGRRLPFGRDGGIRERIRDAIESALGNPPSPNKGKLMHWS
jgi:hypothetical protein